MAIVIAGAARTAPPLDVYGNLPAFERASVSPSGDRIAAVATVDGVRRLVVVDRANRPLLTYPVNRGKLRSIDWAGDDKVLVRISQTVEIGQGYTASHAELSSVVVVPLNGGHPWPVFEGKRTVTGGVSGDYGVAQRDGHWYGYFSAIPVSNGNKVSATLTTHAEPALYEVDLDNGKIAEIGPANNVWDIGRSWLVGADGRLAATLDFSTTDGSWIIMNFARKTIASGKAPGGGVWLIGLGRTPGTIVYTTSGDDGRQRCFEVPIAGGAVVEALPQGRSPFVDDRRRRLAGYVDEGDDAGDREHFFDARHEKVMAATRKAFPGFAVGLTDWNDAFDRLIVRTDGPGDAGRWWTVDIRTGKADILGVDYMVAPRDVGPVRMVPYKAADGLAMSGVLTLPPDREAKKLPVIILPHGGPGARDYAQFDWWAQAFAARGYAVLQPNFRGSTGLGVDFQNAGHGEWGRKMQTDLSDGLAELARLGIADPKRACIMGASYGGYAALAGVTLQHGLYRCAVSVAGVSDVVELYDTDVLHSNRANSLIHALKEELGPESDLKKVSPRRFAAQADAPILLIHGKDDTRVLYAQSSAMARELKQAGKPYELVTLPGEDHWLSRGETRLAMLTAAVAFVEKYNPADPAPAVAAAAK
jgi:dienelactone hydrolase